MTRDLPLPVETPFIHAGPDTAFQDFEPKDGESVGGAEKAPFWASSPMVQSGPRTWLTDERREAVAECRRFGLVPLAISDYLGLSDTTVARYLREAEEREEIEPVPMFLALRGPR